MNTRGGAKKREGNADGKRLGVVEEVAMQLWKAR
jgi:hypothetical protein